MSVEDELTILSVSHYTGDVEDSSSPVTPPFKKTVDSLHSFVAGSEKCRHILYYNRPLTSRKDKHRAYEEHLKEVCREMDVEFNKRPNFSLKDAVVAAIGEIDTKYVMFLEHDWAFLQEISLETIIDVFNDHDDVRYIRFNKRKNIPSGWDNRIVEDQSKPIPLCKVDSFSNNPHIIRKEALETWAPDAEPGLGFWKHINTMHGHKRTLYLMKTHLMDRYVTRQKHTRQLDDIEFIVDRKFKDTIREIGFDNAHQKMGTYLYGGKNSGPYIKHIG